MPSGQKAEGEFADRLNELPKYVVSSTVGDLPWNATVLGDDWPEEVTRLRTRHRRAPDVGSDGRGFGSLRARHFILQPQHLVVTSESDR
jgi:hypothetical protein